MTNRGAVRSEIQKTQVSFTATFAGLSGYPKKVGEGTSSPNHEIGGHKWFIDIYPGGYEEETKEYLSCFLHCTSDEPIVRASYSISILDHSGQQQRKCIQDLFEFKNNGFGWPTFVSQKDLKSPTKEYCFDDTLTILAEITIFGPMKEYKQTVSTFKSNQTIASNLTKLFCDSPTSDVTIIALSSDCPQTSTGKRNHDAMEGSTECTQQEVRIPAHKCILSARSPVFRTMFASGMAEARTNEVRIQDFDAAVVKEFLRFLYTDQCEVAALQEHAEPLLGIACKYQVSGLQTLCENHLCTTLSTETVGNILYLSDLYDAIQLQNRALQYVAEHTKEVVTAGSISQTYSPELTQKIFSALAGVIVSDDYTGIEG